MCHDSCPGVLHKLCMKLYLYFISLDFVSASGQQMFQPVSALRFSGSRFQSKGWASVMVKLKGWPLLKTSCSTEISLVWCFSLLAPIWRSTSTKTVQQRDMSKSLLRRSMDGHWVQLVIAILSSHWLNKTGAVQTDVATTDSVLLHHRGLFRTQK